MGVVEGMTCRARRGGTHTAHGTSPPLHPFRAAQSERDSKEEIAKVFALFDHEGSGKVSFRDLKRVVSELGEGISDEEMREMIEEADRDGDGEAAGRWAWVGAGQREGSAVPRRISS